MEASALRHRQVTRSGIRPRGALLRLRSDEQLLVLLRAGNEDAFAAIAARYELRLLAYVRRMLGGAAADAEDVVQDVLISAYRALGSSDGSIALKPWLYRVAHNRAIDHLRRPAPDLGEIYELNRPVSTDPAESSERRERLERLVAAIGELPEQQRSALLMREMDGLSYAELATVIETTVPAVKSLLVRARMGLVEHHKAESAECADVRSGLLDAYRRGVRMSGLARRHVATCDGCRSYHHELRDTDRALAALAGGSPFSALAKLLGIGSAGGGAAAAGGGVTSGAVVAGGACAAATCGVGTFAVISGKGLAVLSAAAVLGAPANSDRPAPAPKTAQAAIKRAPQSAIAAAVTRPVATLSGQRAAVVRSNNGSRQKAHVRYGKSEGHRAVGFIVAPESASAESDTAVSTTTTATTTTPTATGTTTATTPTTSTTTTTTPTTSTATASTTATAVAANAPATSSPSLAVTPVAPAPH